MDLIEVDDVNLQATQAVFALLADGSGRVHFGDAAVLVPAHGALGEEVRAPPFPFAESECHYFLGVAYAVDDRGVDPVAAKLELAVNSADPISIVSRPPSDALALSAAAPGPVS